MKKHHHDKDIIRIANFMNGFLGFEMLEEIPCIGAFLYWLQHSQILQLNLRFRRRGPDHLQSDYEDLEPILYKNRHTQNLHLDLKSRRRGAVPSSGNQAKNTKKQFTTKNPSNPHLEKLQNKI